MTALCRCHGCHRLDDIADGVHEEDAIPLCHRIFALWLPLIQGNRARSIHISSSSQPPYRTLPLHPHTPRSCWTAATLAPPQITVHCDRQDVDTHQVTLPILLGGAADYYAVLRIRDVYPGSMILILLIPDPGSKNSKQKRRVKKICFHTFFEVTNFTKLIIFLLFKCRRKKFGPILKELLKFLPKNFQYALKYMGLGSRGQKGTGSRIRNRFFPASCSPPPTRHNSSLAPTTLPEELLPARLCAGLPPPDAAAAGTPLRRTFPFPGAVNTLLPPADRGPNRQGLHAQPQAAQTHADTEPAQLPCRGRPSAQASLRRVPPPPRRYLEPSQGVTFQLPLVKPATCGL